ncbi:hypothetical protein FSW04_15220 [Baekduia soli]|uniref:Uncharacterized protein n=1 Tax=Baekduia soli TaxID=496014 RepID=A0A5B8U771_9ACTN|nr:hypothetical protein [Baekduia soli]QEC48791.1 hypothetical protein FSW04_15220 [Baekduia soli]
MPGAVAVGVLRLLLMPVILIGERLVSHPVHQGAAFVAVLAAGALYAVGALAAHLRSWRRGRARAGSPAAWSRSSTS